MNRPGFVTACLVLSAGLFVSCATRQMPAWDISAPGWSTREAAALWRPDSRSPELAGELSIATRADGSRLVQFSKQGVPVVIARTGPAGWDIGSPFREQSRGGAGRPPAWSWFLIDGFPPSQPADKKWSLKVESDGRWILENSKRGERLEVVP